MTVKIPRKPLIFAENPFDNERLDDIENRDANWDASYVPGYSEAKADNETRAGQKLKAIPIPKLVWLRTQSTAGRDLSASNDVQLLNYMREGYRAMGLDDLDRYGYKMPVTATVTADGLIRRADTALFFVDENRAARNLAKRRQAAAPTKSIADASKTGALYEDKNEAIEGKLSDLASIPVESLFAEGRS